MTHDTPHRSRTAWPGPLSIAGVGEGHTHDLPPALLKRIRRQGRAVLIIGACVVALGVLFLLIILQRGEQRDQENRQLEEQIRQGQCDLLDQLPEGGLLDRPRGKYGCGPGIPISDLPPEVQQELANRGGSPAVSPPTPSPPDTPRPDVMGGASPNAPVVVPAPPPSFSDPTPEPPPEPPPGPLEPITDRICDALGVCLQ